MAGIAAAVEVADDSEVTAVLSFLVAEGLLSYEGYAGGYTITARGWQRVERFR